MLIVECAICGDRRDPVTHKWATPTREDRVITHKKKKSHGYCDECFIILMRDSGMSDKEIKDILLENYNNLTRR